jgi:hypothetical protein
MHNSFAVRFFLETSVPYLLRRTLYLSECLGALSDMQEAGEDKQAQSTQSTLVVYVRQAISHHSAQCDLQGLPIESTTLLINTAISLSAPSG